MSKLPKRFDEAAAYQFARDWVDEQRAWYFHPDAEQLYGQPMMTNFLRVAGPFFADEIVFLADHGSVQADAALREVIAERTDRNVPLGAVLGAYNIRLLNPQREKKSGPKTTGTLVRDSTIALLVHETSSRFPELGIYRNTNSKATRETVSTIVAQVLAEAGIISTDYKTVEKIFDRYWKFRGWPPLKSKSSIVLGIPPSNK